jgi:hypothetical protein
MGSTREMSAVCLQPAAVAGAVLLVAGTLFAGAVLLVAGTLLLKPAMMRLTKSSACDALHCWVSDMAEATVAVAVSGRSAPLPSPEVRVEPGLLLLP